jgi:hypothetical protein
MISMYHRSVVPPSAALTGRHSTLSLQQISSACGCCTKEDVPFAVQNNICLVGYIALRAEWQSGGRGRRFDTASAIQISSAYGKRTKKDVPFGVKITCTGWAHSALRAEWRNGGRAARDVGSSLRAPYKYHPLAVNAPKRMCLLGYKIIFAWWAHIALRAE